MWKWLHLLSDPIRQKLSFLLGYQGCGSFWGTQAKFSQSKLIHPNSPLSCWNQQMPFSFLAHLWAAWELPYRQEENGCLETQQHWYKGQGAECRKSRKHSLPIVSVSSESRLSWPNNTRNHPQLAGLYVNCSWILQLPFPIEAARGKAWLQQHQQDGIPPWHSSCVGTRTSLVPADEQPKPATSCSRDLADCTQHPSQQRPFCWCPGEKWRMGLGFCHPWLPGCHTQLKWAVLGGLCNAWAAADAAVQRRNARLQPRAATLAPVLHPLWKTQVTSTALVFKWVLKKFCWKGQWNKGNRMSN